MSVFLRKTCQLFFLRHFVSSYDDLVALVPTLNGMMMDGETPATADLVTTKPSKAAILQRSIDYVQWLEKEGKAQEEELEMVRREVTGLKIMKDHYQLMLAEAKQVGHESNDAINKTT